MDAIVYNPPFIVFKNPKGFESIRRHKDFSTFPKNLWDPYERFVVVDEHESNGLLAGLSSSVLDAFHHTDDHNWVLGIGFEAIASPRAVFHEAYYYCKFRNCLTWDGESSSSWRDMYCKSCGSCFEIKSKATQDRATRTLYFGTHRGGSFRRWCSPEPVATKNREGKDYLVLVSRAETVPLKGPPVYNVQLAEIDTVTPRLVYSAFLPNRSHSRLLSTIHIRSRTRVQGFECRSKRSSV
mmetsp:Transcript_24536/g.57155  ORF Transcript_24536/g.57155 Transcript_24536/m.57155 type:complete len:239 (+) Transcript_24536:978-1694(+)